jgi:hypothetical protein
VIGGSSDGEGLCVDLSLQAKEDNIDKSQGHFNLNRISKTLI